METQAEKSTPLMQQYLAIKEGVVMISQETMQEAIERLVLVYNPLEIYLFGPYAWGTPDEEDDVDLLVVVESSDKKPPQRTYVGFKVLFGLGIPPNVVVFTKQEFDRFASDVTSSTYEIKTKGKLLYARD